MREECILLSSCQPSTNIHIVRYFISKIFINLKFTFCDKLLLFLNITRYNKNSLIFITIFVNFALGEIIFYCPPNKREFDKVHKLRKDQSINTSVYYFGNKYGTAKKNIATTHC
jgi:hypothetical protein